MQWRRDYYMSVYLDYNASAPINTKVLDYMVEIYKTAYGNADSRTHDYGNSARNIVEQARGKVAHILGINKDEVFFTSGATESNNIVLQGLKDYAVNNHKKHIITTAIEHKAVLETTKHLQTEGFDVDIVFPDRSGRISPNAVRELLRDDTLIVSIQHVNNETGIIQPVQEIGDFLSDKGVFFHVDATQSFGKLVPELKSLKYDMLSMSAHKIGGPQGIGALVLKKKRYHLPPVKGIMYGGQQEHGIRPGTIPVALTAGCGCACEIAEQNYEENLAKTKHLKTVILRILRESGIEFFLNGDQQYCVNNTVNICIPGVMSEALMIATKQYCGISNGSACTSSNYAPSYVLSAMGLSDSDIECSVRISWGSDTAPKELEENFRFLIETAKQLKG